MFLIKRILFYVFLVLAVLLGVWGYFSLKNNKKPNVEALSLLPDSCLVYLNTTNFQELNKKLNSQSLIIDKLKLFGDINEFCNSLNTFDSIFSVNPSLAEEIKNKHIHFAIYDKNLDWLASFNISQLGKQKGIIQEIKRVLSATAASEEIYKFKLHRNKDFYFSIRSGVVLISNSEEKISDAYSVVGPKLLNNTAFKKFRASIQDNGLLSVYIDHRKYYENDLSSRLNLSAICESGFSAGNIDLQPSEVKVNGFLNPGEKDFVSVLSNEPAQPTDFMSILPLTVSHFKAYGFDSYKHLQQQADHLWKANESPFWKQVNDSALYNLQDEFFENIQTSLVEFETSTGQRFVAAQVNDSLKALSHLKLMSDSLLRQPGDSVFRLTTSNGSADLFSPLSLEVLNFVFSYKSYLFFSRNAYDLLQLRSYLKNEMLLIKDKSFANYKEQNIPENFNLIIYSSPNQSRELISRFFNFETKCKKDPFKNFKHFSFSLRNDGGKFKFRWHLINETESDTKEQNNLWTLKLDTTASMKPAAFVNHITKENEILVQDHAEKLYLINAKGSILWKKVLNEKISSPVFRVDVFKNNKYQFLFSSKNYLHLLDRNGHYVDGYPVKLPAESSAALAMFDYDETRDYRLFIPCKNNLIYNFSISGKKQEGFLPVKTDYEVDLPVQYVKVGQSDYLVALDKEGKIYTFSRRGDGRIGLNNRATANCTAFYVDATNNIHSTHFVYVDDKNGLINKISFADKKEISKLNFDIENADVNFTRVDDNKMMDVFFTRMNTLLAYDLNGNLLVKKTIEADLSESEVFRNENYFVLLSYSKFRRELVIIDQLKQKSRTVNASALPLVSDLFNDNKKYLIITSGKVLNCMALE